MNSNLHILDSSSAAPFAARSSGIRWSEPSTTIKHSQLRINIFALMTFFIHLVFLSCPKAIALTYTTDFPLSENPLSEGGNWINGTITETYSGCAVTNTAGGLHYAYGLQSGTNIDYDDSLAALTGDWGPTQAIDITIYCTNQLPQSSGVYEEIEYGLRCTLSNHLFAGYFMDCSLNSDSGYVELGVSYGFGSNTNWGADNYGAQYVVHNGSKIHAEIINNTISIFFDGVLVLQSTDPTGLGPTNGGAPLIGFYHTGSGHQTNFGISSFTATDTIDPPLTLVSPLVTNEQFSFSFQTELGQSYFILQFTNLLASDSGTYTRITGTGLPYQFSMPVTNTQPCLFFRVLKP